MKYLKILFKSTELLNKILFSLLMIIIFRCLSHIPVPFVDINQINIAGNTDVFGLINMFSGGALKNFTIMATGTSAYITASIVIQMFSYFIKPLHMMARSPGGDKKIKKLTMILGVFVALISSVITTKTMNDSYSLLTNESWYVFVIIAILHAIGTAVAILIGESISEKGFGNGISLMISINVLTSVPSIISDIKNNFGITITLSSLLTMIFMIIIIIIMTIIAETSERKIPLFYPKAAARGMKQYNKNSMFFPIKLNISGVMPIILASYIIQLFSLIGNMQNKLGYFVHSLFDYNSIQYIFIFTILIFAFTYLYALISFDSKEISDNMQKNGAIIPGIRQGKETSTYISEVRKGIVLISAIYLSLVYFIPTMILSSLDINYVTATSVIILVGVSIDTCKSLKVELELRNYKTL